RKRLDVRRRVGRVAERRPDLTNAEVQTLIEVDERIRRPDFLPQLLPRDERARASEQHAEDLERLRRQTHAARTASQLSGPRVQREGAELNRSVRIVPLGHGRAEIIAARAPLLMSRSARSVTRAKSLRACMLAAHSTLAVKSAVVS